MILPDKNIESLSKNKNLIVPFKKEHLRASSYDLSVGGEYYIGEDGGNTSINTQLLNSRQSFKIPPHAVCFIITEESIKLPSYITAQISLRMTHIYKGAVLTSQPPFDPGYEGKAILMIYNLSSTPINLQRGDRLATIQFTRLLSEPETNKIHRSVFSIEEQLCEPLISSLSEIAKTSKSANKKVTHLVAHLVGYLTLVIATLAVPSVISYGYFNERLKSTEVEVKRNEGHETKIQELSELLIKYEQIINDNSNKYTMLESKLKKLKLSKETVPVNFKPQQTLDIGASE